MAQYIVEIAAPRNRNVRFGPTLERLRGRWSHTVTGGRSVHESLSRLHMVAPEIPGIYLSLDTKIREAKRYDPLRETEEGRRLWVQIEEVCDLYHEYFGRRKPWDTAVYPNMHANDMKTWLFEMRKLVDAGLARPVSGSDPLPDLDKIRQLPGGRMTNFWTNQFIKPEDRLADVVPLRGAPQEVTSSA